MKVLYISYRSKNNIAAKCHLQALKELFGVDNVFEIDLFNPRSIRKKNYISYGYNKYSPLRVVRWLQGNVGFISNGIIKEIINILRENRINLVFSEESILGNFVMQVKKSLPNVYIICFFHDISAQLFRQRKAKASKFRIHYQIECELGIKQEQFTVYYSDENWVFHKADSDRYYYYYKRRPQAVIPLCGFVPNIDEDDFSNRQSSKNTQILFVCSKYNVNTIGFLWFFKNVYPFLKGNFSIKVVGSGTNKLRDVIHEERIEILGYVNSVEKYYIDTDIVIIPVFDGGGMKLKTLEAISFGKCIVSTQECLNGFWEELDNSIRGKVVYNCNSSDEWIMTLNELIESDIKGFNYSLFDIYKRKFSYEEMKNKFAEKLLNYV